MKKEPMTLHIEPLLKYALAEESLAGNYKNVNTYVVEILNNHIKKKQQEEKLLNKISEIDDRLEAISQVLEIMITK